MVTTIPQSALDSPATGKATIDLRPESVQAERKAAQLETLTGSGPMPRLPRPRWLGLRVMLLTLLATVLGGAGGWYGVTRWKAARLEARCESPWPVVRGGGKLWVAVELPIGAPVALLQGGTRRENAGVALVVENADGRSRLLTENISDCRRPLRVPGARRSIALQR